MIPILLIVLFFLIILFIIEVVVGSSVEVYNPEIGFVGRRGRITKLTVKDFFFRLLPLILLVVLVPLMFSLFY